MERIEKYREKYKIIIYKIINVQQRKVISRRKMNKIANKRNYPTAKSK